MEEERGSALAAESALEKNVAELTVMDVYDIASLVGHEFERVIDQHGCEAIARLMPKVVRVLEILEVLVSRHHVAPELDELRLELDRLRLERMDRIEKERKHQKELELVEDVWRGEAQDLLSQIAQLQEENKQLMTNLSHKDVNFSEEEFQKHEGVELLGHRETMLNFRHFCRVPRGLRDPQGLDLRALSRFPVHQCTHARSALHPGSFASTAFQIPAGLVMNQPTLLDISYQWNHTAVGTAVRWSLSETQERQGPGLLRKAGPELSEEEGTGGNLGFGSIAGATAACRVQAGGEGMEKGAAAARKQPSIATGPGKRRTGAVECRPHIRHLLYVVLGGDMECVAASWFQSIPGGAAEETEPVGEDSISDAEKVAMDLKDPNRPRFTLQELRDVLHERNELKSKVFLLQEELAYYKSEEMEEENRIPQPPPIAHPRTSPQPESGIKRLFSFFSRDKKRLANTQRNVHIQESFGQWANTHRDDGYTEQGQEALQHL
ncbi:RILP-like protein 1 [Hylobates moloch]|uniref:RILP-like protein 1 n=1 Tax=Hylobates moloch TaxID=81572 RepID=UPI00267667E0|nr:RILP-like protein 1 [Hylobates moloch]